MDIEAVLREVGSPEPTPQGPAKPRKRVPGVKPRDWMLPGFGPMTRIATSLGDVPAGALRVRDMVRTKSGDFKPIVWLDRIVLDEEYLSLHPDALPVHVRAGALGRGLPSHDVFLAPRQPIDAQGSRLPARHREAVDFLGRPGVFRKAEAMYSYTLFHLGEPHVVQTSRLFVHVTP